MSKKKKANPLPKLASKPVKSAPQIALTIPKMDLGSKQNLWTSIGIASVYGILLLYVGIFHFEPWRDLAHIWVAVRDGSFIEIFTKLPIGAHPFLWLLLIKPLTLLGAPYISSIILNILFCIAGAFLLLRYAPIPLIIKVLFIASYAMIYEMALPGRIYALGTFLVFLACTMESKKNIHPILFAIILSCLMHTHAVFIGFWAPLALYFVYSIYKTGELFTKKTIISVSILFVSGLYFLWYVYQNSKFSALLNVGVKKNFLTNTLSYSFLGDASNLLALPFLAMVAFILLLYRTSYVLVGLFMIAFSFYVYHSVVPEFLRYYLLFMVLITGVFWLISSEIYAIAHFKDRIQKYAYWVFIIGFGLCQTVSAKNGIQMLVREIRQSHSDAGPVGDFIAKNYLDYTIIGHRSYTASAIVPYLPKGKQIWLADQQQYITYLTFDSLYYKTVFAYTYQQALETSLKKFPDQKNILLLFSIPLPESELQNWKLVYATQQAQIQKDEVYYIYVRV